VESSSVDSAILIWLSSDCPGAQLIQEILRVLKVGGIILIRKSPQSTVGSFDKVITSYIVSRGIDIVLLHSLIIFPVILVDNI